MTVEIYIKLLVYALKIFNGFSTSFSFSSFSRARACSNNSRYTTWIPFSTTPPHRRTASIASISLCWDLITRSTIIKLRKWNAKTISHCRLKLITVINTPRKPKWSRRTTGNSSSTTRSLRLCCHRLVPLRLLTARHRRAHPLSTQTSSRSKTFSCPHRPQIRTVCHRHKASTATTTKLNCGTSNRTRLKPFWVRTAPRTRSTSSICWRIIASRSSKTIKSYASFCKTRRSNASTT